MASAPEPILQSRSAVIGIEVDDLFGLYSYRLGGPDASPEDLSRLLILYGDNGSGKTTILRLVYHMLSKVDDQGHRTAIARIPFRRFLVRLWDSVEVAALRSQTRLTGDYHLSLTRHGQLVAQAEAVTDEQGVVNQARLSPDQRTQWANFITELSRLPITLHYVSDDRRPEVRQEEQEVLEAPIDLVPAEVAQHQIRTYVTWAGGVTARLRDESSLDIAVTSVEQLIRTEVLRRSTQGEANTNTIYTEIVRQLAQPRRGGGKEVRKVALVPTLLAMEERSKAFSSIGLISPFPVADLVKVIEGAPRAAQATVESVLTPYLDGVQARLDALQGIQELVAIFLGSINSFFFNKGVSFDLNSGLRIVAKNGARLAPSMLSSGEKQLLLLFCNTITVTEQPTIFIIDEPEISLNVKWQRKLIKALLDLARGSNVQFIFATHSLELLSLHRKHVVKLVEEPENN